MSEVQRQSQNSKLQFVAKRMGREAEGGVLLKIADKEMEMTRVLEQVCTDGNKRDA